MKFLTLTIIAIALLTNPAISQETKTTDHMQEMESEGMKAEGMEDMEGITDMKAEGMEEIKTEVMEGMACM